MTRSEHQFMKVRP